MAKVKIQGHASGTGVLTVTAPNTSTDRTITLPDSTDTLAVNSDVTNKLPLAGGTMTGALTINSGANLAFQANGTSYTQIWQTLQSPNDLTLKTTADKYISFQPNSTEKVRIHSNGVTSFNNGIELGSGLDATAANTLDDYEEGTWSPTITCSTSGSYTLQGAADLAAYTKIGRVVTVQGGLSVNGESSPNGNLRITLPFTAFQGTDDTDFSMGNLALGNHGSTLDVQSLNAFVMEGNYFFIWGVNPDGTTRYINHTDVDTNFQVYFNFSYIAA